MDRTRTRLYAFGSNGAGQLGVGHIDDLTEPQLCQFAVRSSGRENKHGFTYDHLPENNQVKKLVAGGNHTLLLVQNGSLYACGSNSDGRCAIENGPEDVHIFTTVPWGHDKSITHVAATWETSFFVENARVVWTCGSGSKGELGLGEEHTKLSTPAKVFDTRQVAEDCVIVDISAGMSHVVVVLSNGHVYGWGSCRRGQLGDAARSAKVAWTPKQVDLPFAVSQAVCGRDFTLCRGHEKGHALLGELKTIDESSLHMLQEQSEVLAGWTSLYVFKKGNAHGFGQGRRGQLPPTTLPVLSKMVAGSEHCVALTDVGDVVCWGWGEHGNCGSPLDDRGNVHDRFNKIYVSAENGYAISGVGAGCATSFFWTSNHAD